MGQDVDVHRASAPRKERGTGLGRLPPGLLVGLAALVVMLPALLGGLWEAQELPLADAARRVALNWLGAGEAFRLEGADNELPTLEEWGRGDLPVMVAAVVLRVLGLSVGAIRASFVLVGIAFVVVNYLGARALWGERAARLVVAVVLSTPALVLPFRGVFGDAFAFLGCSAGFLSLAVLCFAPPPSRRARGAILGCALLALACASGTRGTCVGIFLPLAPVGLAALREPAAWQKRLGGGLLVMACLWGIAGLMPLWGDGERMSRLAGASVSLGKKFWTHDQVMHYLGHGFFPWSLLLPAALGAALSSGRGNLRGPDEETVASHPGGEGAERAVVYAVLLGMAVYSLLGERSGLQPFAFGFAVAILLALQLERWQQSHGLSLSGGLSASALLVLLLVDFRNFPEKAFSSFGTIAAEVPESLRGQGFGWWLVAALLVGLPLLLSIAGHTLDGVAWVRSWARRFERHFGFASGFFLAGCLLNLGLYPSLSLALSPTGVFESYRRYAAPGEPLGTMGDRGSLAAFHGAGDAQRFEQERDAVAWLAAPDKERRWLAITSERLAQITSKFRSQTGRLLPVVDADSPELLLAVSTLPPGMVNDNPLATCVRDEPPTLAHPTARTFGTALDLVGWEIREHGSQGGPIETLSAGERYRFVMAYRVKGRISREWKTFIHIDGRGRRFNGDHDTVGGRYPMKLWRPGDVIVDEYEFALDDDLPAGSYAVYFGLFSGDDRMEVSAGEHDDNRVLGGHITLR